MAKITVNDLRKVTTVGAKTDSVKGHRSHGLSKTNKQTMWLQFLSPGIPKTDLGSISHEGLAPPDRVLVWAKNP